MIPCPDHEALACFIECRLADSDHVELARHIASCSACLDVVAAAAPQGDEQADAPVVSRTRLEPRPNPTPRDWSSWPRALAAGLALLATGGLGYVATGAATEYARVTAVRMATARLGVAVDIERLEIALGADLRSIRVRVLDLDLGALGRAAAAEIVLSPTSLAFGAPVVRTIRLFAPEFLWSLSGEYPERLPPRAALGALTVASTVEFIDAVVRVGQPHGPAIIIDHVSGTTTRDGDRVYLRATGHLAGGTVSLHGTHDAEDAENAEDTKDVLDLTIGARNVPSTVLPYIRDWVDGRATVALRVVGNASNLRWAGRMHVVDGVLRRVTPLRDLAAAFHIAPSIFASIGGTAADLRMTFRVDNEGWRVPRSILVQGDLETRATLRSRDGARLTGEGIAELSATRSQTLIARYPFLGRYDTPGGRLVFPFGLRQTSGRVVVVPR